MLVRRLSHLATAALLAPPAAAAVAAATDPEAALAAAQAPVRLARTLGTAASVIVDYKRTRARVARLSGGDDETSTKERERLLRECHSRGASALRDLCHANGGIYVKLGQHLATLDHLLPSEYVGLMKTTMLNTCPVSSYEGVARTIEEDLGKKPEELFASFEREPVASASLAQVHRAVSRDGRVLAVKVQHRGLREACAADVATVSAIASAARWLFDDFDLGWLVDEIKANLPRELDFRLEAENAARCQRNLDSDGSSVGGGGGKGSPFSLGRRRKGRSRTPPPSRAKRVRVPDPAPDLSSSRVLCMEWIDGVPVADRDSLIKNGIDPSEVASLVARAFAEMTFKHGFVHSDAHPGNALVQVLAEGGEEAELDLEKGSGDGDARRRRKRKRRRASVVLLDHGLYRELTDEFRVRYAGLWAAILSGDEASILRRAREMGAGEAGPLFASMLTMKPWRAISGNDDVFLGEGGKVKVREADGEARELPPTTTEAMSSAASPSPSAPAATNFADRLAATEADAAEARAYASEHAGDINALLARLPRELLLLLKTNDCLRSLDRSLGVSPANSFVATAEAVREALFEAGRGDEWKVGGGGLLARAAFAFAAWRNGAR